jgi:limonene 1,2-monooxygenase
MRDKPLRFGVFHSPWHEPGRNPHLQLHQDLELAEHLDRLGFDELWVGEHHSGGFELVGAPEVFIATAAQRTKHLRIGAGVISVTFHHPLIVADRITYLDHITRGRAMFGFGPGSLPADARMMGYDYSTARLRMEAGVEAIVRLIESDEPVTMETEWFKLHEATLQLYPYSFPRMELATAANRSPAGPRLAGQFGIGLLSIAATQKGGFDFLRETWRIAEDKAGEFGRTIDRSNWRAVGPMYCSESVETAIEETRYGFDGFLRFAAAAGSGTANGQDIEDRLATTDHAHRLREMNESRYTSFGPPELCIDQIERLLVQSGGFGCFLIQLFDYANREDTFRSLELFASEVMPHFQGSQARARKSWIDMYERRAVNVVEKMAAQDKVVAMHEAEQRAKRADG